MHKTDLLTNEGLYENVIMLFELRNAPATLQRLMNLIFADYINEFVTINLDHIFIDSGTY